MSEKKTLYFSRIREVIAPQRGTKESAGIDFFMPKFTETFLTDLKAKNPNISEIREGSYSYYIDETNKRILLGAHERLLIPSGIKIRGHENIAINAHNKSGVASKKGLDRLAECVDFDYQGELHSNIVNTSNYIVEICEDEKLLQFLECKIDMSELQELLIDDLFLTETDRGEGGFGSTNKKN